MSQYHMILKSGFSWEVKEDALINIYDGHFYTCIGSESGQVEIEQHESAASSATVPSSECTGIRI